MLSLADLLHCIHVIGREDRNEFSEMCKLSDVTATPTDVTEHPVFGLKSNIIRLLANAVHQHKSNQDLVRPGFVETIVYYMY